MNNIINENYKNETLLPYLSVIYPKINVDKALKDIREVSTPASIDENPNLL